mgnify:CR=1 FL=1
MTTELTLTQDQENAIAAFASFMLSDDKEMVISGPAGVGKTTMLRFLLERRPHEALAQTLGTEVPSNWIFTATTNKAADVLARSMNQDCGTIHSTLGLRVFSDTDSGRTKIVRTDKSQVIDNSILIIDEASMVDSQLLKFIDEGTINCKIVYIGDHCQLAPVHEPISPVFADRPRTEINQIVRSQNAPAITALAQQLRETVETGVFKPILPVPGVIDYLTPAEAEQAVREHFVDTDTEDRILCYTNRKVIAFNNYVRNLRQLPPEVTEGEWLVSNNAVKLSNRKMLQIEQEVRVLGVGEIFDYTPYDGSPLPVRKLDTICGQILVPVDPVEYHNHIKAYSRRKAWMPYFELKERIADLRPRDASTVYKAQGSTYRTTFVDLRDIGTCTNPSQAARMLYVACTRPTHQLKFIGDLPPRFKGND